MDAKYCSISTKLRNSVLEAAKRKAKEASLDRLFYKTILLSNS